MEEALVGVQVAASIITLSKGISDFMDGRVKWGEKAERLRVMNQEVKNLRDKIPEMIEANEKLLGYKELHKEAQEFLIVVDKLETYIRYVYEDRSRVLAHIEKLLECITRDVESLLDSVIYTTEKYSFLKEDGKVTDRIDSIRDMLKSMHLLVESAWRNKSTDLDINVKTDFNEIFKNLASLMRHLDTRIKEISDKINAESGAFKNRLKESRRKEENGNGH
jgi:predicted house-cleaning noncanonical NTP pyrophosphatase (MazG superfamily)